MVKACLENGLWAGVVPAPKSLVYFELNRLYTIKADYSNNSKYMLASR